MSNGLILSHSAMVAWTDTAKDAYNVIIWPSPQFRKKRHPLYCTKHWFPELDVVHSFIYVSNQIQWHPAIPNVKGQSNFYLLLVDRKLIVITWRNQGLAFVIGGFLLLLGPVLRGLTVHHLDNDEMRSKCRDDCSIYHYVLNQGNGRNWLSAEYRCVISHSSIQKVLGIGSPKE